MKQSTGKANPLTCTRAYQKTPRYLVRNCQRFVYGVGERITKCAINNSRGVHGESNRQSTHDNCCTMGGNNIGVKCMMQDFLYTFFATAGIGPVIGNVTLNLMIIQAFS